jgi:hydroxymethylpyrimidine pyrophosphatase-like HAD family hydrolase
MNAPLIEKILWDKKDILAEKLLTENAEADFNKICELAPQLNSWDFIGTENSKWKFLIGDTGKITIETTVIIPNKIHDYRKEVFCIFDPEKEKLPYAGRKSEQHLLEGWLPIDMIDFITNSEKWTQESFAWTEKGKTHVYIKISTPKKELFYKANEPEAKTKEELMNQPYKSPEISDKEEYEKNLSKLKAKWKSVFAKAAQAKISDSRVLNCAKNSIIKSFHSCVGQAMHYGVTRYFCDTDRNAESFAPTTISMTDTCLEWGFFKEAGQRLGYFLNNFVTENGQLIHRGNGASISEHGMLLETFARQFNYTQDHDFARKHLSKIKEICNLLLNGRNEGKRLPENSNASGLIKGCPEDDVRLWESDYWYSGNCWACRGLIEAGKLFSNLGENTFAEELNKESALYRNDILTSIRKSIVGDFIPPCPGYDKPFDNFSDKIYYKEVRNDNLLLSAYSNYRFYPEMLSSGILDKDLCDSIIRYREEHGGEFLGMIKLRAGNELRLNNWPVFNYLRCLLENGNIRKFHMVLYSHMACHQARNTFFAPEGTWHCKLDSIHCAPSQLTVPLALKWALAYEERDSEEVHLLKGIPESWLPKGESISVEKLPTRWGRISFQIKRDSQTGEIFGSITLDMDNTPQKIHLHIPGLETIVLYPDKTSSANNIQLKLNPRSV